MISIRRAGDEHIDVLRRLHREALPTDRFPNFRHGWWWIAYRDGEPVGFAGMTPSARWADAMYFARAGVLPCARGLGLQRRLITARERFARSHGMRWLISDTRENPHSANNLIRAGFLTYLPSKPWGFRTATYWRKKLDT